MSYAASYANATDAALIQRLEMALANAAVSIINEPDSVQRHSERAGLAGRVLTDPVGWAGRMIYGLVADGSISAASPDSSLDARLGAIWNSYL